MALIIHKRTLNRLDPAVVERWRGIPPAILGDERNRTGAMSAALRPVSEGAAFVGAALTVKTFAGDNLALHHAVARVQPGDVLVVDAGGYIDVAVWGGILQSAAEKRGVVGVVIDGAVRDVAELRSGTAPVYCRGVTPSGPHKGWGGEINGPVQCGGCLVMPGDLVCGDDDGVAVAPRPLLKDLLRGCIARMDAERRILDAVAGGANTVELLGLPPPDQDWN